MARAAAMAAAAAAAALRALPGGGSLDEPVVEYLAGAGGAHLARAVSLESALSALP